MKALGGYKKGKVSKEARYYDGFAAAFNNGIDNGVIMANSISALCCLWNQVMPFVKIEKAKIRRVVIFGEEFLDKEGGK